MSEDLLLQHHASAKGGAYFLAIASEAASDAPIAQEFP
jgi:hypothetical protein